jgi:hypothetical protein
MPIAYILFTLSPALGKWPLAKQIITVRYSYFSWIEISSMPMPRYQATSVVDANDNMWVFGGTQDDSLGNIYFLMFNDFKYILYGVYYESLHISNVQSCTAAQLHINTSTGVFTLSQIYLGKSRTLPLEWSHINWWVLIYSGT